MRVVERLSKWFVIFGAFTLSTLFAWNFGAGGLWRGFEPAHAVTGTNARGPYDITRLEAVNETLKYIRDKYVEPDRVKPQRMLLSALNNIQREVAQVIVYSESPDQVTVRVDDEQKQFRIDNVQGPWDVSARLREIFAFLQTHLKNTEVDLREVEYAACNGMLRTLDPHSVFLSPEAYQEMNVQTSGAFGGLGIVISVRDQMLTVMKPMPGTPAGRAGLERLDRIMKIDSESTLNMPLDSAVDRLRGDPGSKVTLHIRRDGDGGWQGTRPFVLTREQIKVASVIFRRLDSGVGYVRLKTFQATTTSELDDALTAMREQGQLTGLVMDLRGNPGGLLEQAAKVSDRFLTDGVIVATQGGFDGRDEKRARSSGTEPPYPMVVLVNSSSASASEIVAGALKNQDRALIVGQRTFGKGSVQLVFPDITAERAALKLTIAQYLTPGDVSIQGVGIVPDIELDPMTVDVQEMDIDSHRDALRERDLSASLSNRRAAAPSRPKEVVRYQFNSIERQQMREDGDDADEYVEDFPIRFARDLVAQLPPNTSRGEQLEQAMDFIDHTRSEELAKVSKELGAMGINWAAAPVDAPKPGRDSFEVTIGTDREDMHVTAGEPLELHVTVKNTGEQAIYRLRGTTESENSYFDKKELVFGKIAPGESKTAVAPLGWCDVEGRKVGSSEPVAADAKRTCKIPMEAQTRSDGLGVRFSSDRNVVPAPVEIRPTVKALPQPVFEYAYQIVDDRGGNGDGKLQRGERASLYLTVRNTGEGQSYETSANLVNLSGVGLFLHAGRFDISNMKPGDVRQLKFTFDVTPQLSESFASFTLSVADRDLRESSSEKVKIPIEPDVAVTKAEGTRKAKKGARLYSEPGEQGRGFGIVPEGTKLTVTGEAQGYVRVKVDETRFAFIRAGELEDASGTATLPLSFDSVYSHAPPAVEVKAAAMATKKDTIKIQGTAADGERLLDVYVYVGNRKLFYQSNKKGADPRKMTFDFDVPLLPGVNVINVVARENPDTTTRRVLIVRRDGADGAILKTPEVDDPVESWLGQP